MIWKDFLPIEKLGCEIKRNKLDGDVADGEEDGVLEISHMHSPLVNENKRLEERKVKNQ